MNTKEKITQYLNNLDYYDEDEDSTEILLRLESLDIQSFVIWLETTFDIEIDPLDVVYENFRSISRIASLIEKKLGGS